MALRGKAAVLDRPDGEFVIDEVDVPEPESDGLLLRQELCGVCATEPTCIAATCPESPFPWYSATKPSGWSSDSAPG